MRIGKGPRIRIRADFGTAEFDAEYQAAITGNPRPRKDSPSSNSLTWLVARYRETTAWHALSMATRRQRENIFKNVLETAGDKPFAKITKATIVAGRERRASTPAQARNFLDAMRGLFRWAVEAQHVKVDPTEGVANPPRKKGDGFIPWTEEHVEAYRKKWPLGTRQRVWMEVLLASGLRRGDAVTFGRQHIKTVDLPDGRKLKLGILNTEKSRRSVPAIFPVTPEFEQILEGGPCGDLTFICTERRQPFGSKDSFGNEFSVACDQAGVPGSAHGLRKLAAIRAVHRGATTAQLRALFAWTNDSMPALYTRAADRQRLAIEAALLLSNDPATSIPAPSPQVRAGTQKAE
ncbi:tyrosine-type recombinase/integrase [Pseudolabrys taiwanensis]|uniref:tyrosine-type recombinase/integrase n=1 Tax=Pseudolabrys taiwanensis TaxID=331696 RepID=UPI0013B41A64|nr:tyrosine-type recombinase/integrase [Pseudolabrys taiwanensis]